MPRPLLPRLLAAATAAGDHPTDAELLGRFTRAADAAAFELVVRRHAAAVWVACRRILPDADAADAFQAAFLVLARKAGAVRGACAGGWLHRVAVTAALKRKAALRRDPAAPAADPPDPAAGPAAALERAELAAAVHEELARLPDRYRLPVVLCDLEGETQPAAAARLGWPVGSVAGRLSRALALLRDRLTRRGFAPVGSVLVLPLGAVPTPAVSAAVAAATGATPATASASFLAAGVLAAMRTARLKVVAVLLTSAGMAGAAGFGAYSASAQPAPTPPVAAQPKADPPPAKAGPPAGDWLGANADVPTAFPEIVVPNDFLQRGGTRPGFWRPDAVKVEPADDIYRRLLKARLHQYHLYLDRVFARFEAGVFVFAEFFGVMEVCDTARGTAAELWRNDPAALDAFLVELVRLTKQLELMTAARVLAGTDPPQQVHLATAHRLAAEAALWKHRNPGKAP